MKYRSVFFLLACLCIQLTAKGQVWRVQLPFLYGAQGWQISNWDKATENRLATAHTLGVFDMEVTAKKRFTVGFSFQLEAWEFDLISLPDYLEHAHINLPERTIALNNLTLGSTNYPWRRKRNQNFRLSQFKLGLAKNWWFEKWTLDLGVRYIFYPVATLTGTSNGFVSQERFYRLDRWSDYGTNTLECSLRPTLFLSKKISLGASFNWMIHRHVGHHIFINRLSGLDVPEEQYGQASTTNEHLFYLGFGLYYTRHPKKDKKG